MIRETSFLDCENCPEEMSSRFDVPWNFVGEVKGDRPYLVVACGKCRSDVFEDIYKYKHDPKPTSAMTFVTVDLFGKLFVTDDMIEVMVYFGVCERCESVYWAREGPPFRRARSYVGSLV